jgi:hypothetical protein
MNPTTSPRTTRVAHPNHPTTAPPHALTCDYPQIKPSLPGRPRRSGCTRPSATSHPTTSTKAAVPRSAKARRDGLRRAREQRIEYHRNNKPPKTPCCGLISRRSVSLSQTHLNRMPGVQDARAPIPPVASNGNRRVACRRQAISSEHDRKRTGPPVAFIGDELSGRPAQPPYGTARRLDSATGALTAQRSQPPTRGPST